MEPKAVKPVTVSALREGDSVTLQQPDGTRIEVQVKRVPRSLDLPLSLEDTTDAVSALQTRWLTTDMGSADLISTAFAIRDQQWRDFLARL